MPKPKREDGEPRATDFVESLDRGLRLLQTFGERTSPMTLSEVAAAAGLPRATGARRGAPRPRRSGRILMGFLH